MTDADGDKWITPAWDCVVHADGQSGCAVAYVVVLVSRAMVLTGTESHTTDAGARAEVKGGFRLSHLVVVGTHETGLLCGFVASDRITRCDPEDVGPAVAAGDQCLEADSVCQHHLDVVLVCAH